MIVVKAALACRRSAGRDCILLAIKRTEVSSLAGREDRRNPFAVHSMPRNSGHTRRSVPIQPLVAHVARMIDNPEIDRPIVSRISVYVVDLTSGPLAVDERPDDSMSHDELPVQIAHEIATLAMCKRWLSGEATIPRCGGPFSISTLGFFEGVSVPMSPNQTARLPIKMEHLAKKRQRPYAMFSHYAVLSRCGQGRALR